MACDYRHENKHDDIGTQQMAQHGPDDLQAYIDEQGIAAELIGGLGDTPTVPAAAAALGVEAAQIIKTLLFLVEQPDAAAQPVVVISYGEQRVDRGQLAVRWGVGKKRVSLAPAAVVLDLLGYAAGGVPPFGHRTSLPVLIDAGILSLPQRYAGVVYGGGGDDCTMMKLTVDELLRVTGGEIIQLNLDLSSPGTHTL
jgi:prolyl-tRNA editing enzyme YbaK/EbsC (Cys-tRNA(Pro) deacylase)